MSINKMRIFFLLLSIYLSTLIIKPAYSQHNWIVKGGFNYSKLQEIYSQPFYGYSLSVERKIPIGSFFSLNPQILWSKQGGIVEDKPVWSEQFQQGILYKYDLHILKTALDIALAFDFLVWSHNEFSFSIRPYPSFHLDVYDHDEVFKKRQRININDSVIDWENYDFEFKQGDHENFPFDFRTGWSFNAAVLLSYKRYIFEIHYLKNLDTIGQIGQLESIRHKLHGMHFLFGIAF